MTTLLAICLAVTVGLLGLAIALIVHQSKDSTEQEHYITQLEDNAVKADATAIDRECLISRQRIVIIDQGEIIAEQKELLDYYDRVQKRVVRRVIETSPVLTIDAKVWKATASMN